MRPTRLRFTVKNLIIFIAVVALAAATLRAWRRQVYCLGWAEVWAINAKLMGEEAASASVAHHLDRARACEAEASKYTELKHVYERTAYRFWEPLPSESPLPVELR